MIENIETDEGSFLYSPADFNEILPGHTTYCPNNRSKWIRISVASFSLYERFVSTLYAIIQVQY